MQTGHVDRAVEILRRGAKRHPDNYLVLYWHGKTLLQSGAAPGTKDGEEVLAALKTSVRLNPDFWHSRADLGKTLLECGDVEAAISELERAEALNPAATSPLYLLAQAYRRKGDEARARQLIARVSKMQREEREAITDTMLKRIVREGVPGPASHESNR
jgi:predicted Zn-dependent protease